MNIDDGDNVSSMDFYHVILTGRLYYDDFLSKVCTKLGWKGKGTHWDILPLVLSANGHDPDYFDLPSELVIEVPLSHPT